MSDENLLRDTLMGLLHAIRSGDNDFYKKHVSADLTCFEPESQGHIVDGLPFHEFFMTNFKNEDPYHLELIRPTIRVYGDTGYTAYTMVILKKTEGKAVMTKVNETRIWNKQDGIWCMVHFHRSD
jgi:calcium/calmodulin-dependent protein kinase (CaM kinase) II